LAAEKRSFPQKEDKALTSILQARMPDHQTDARDLFAEYLRWVCPMIYDEYEAVFDAEEMIIRDMQEIEIFMPPKGILLLAYDDGLLAGCACTRTIGENVAELKRMYVRPNFRRRGIGASLVKKTIEEVCRQEYSFLRLDSARFMSEAHALYRSLGFRDIEPYKESEIPVEYRKHWVFMELPIIRK
jgi:GNAT superfamily N-acetyltransferase